MIKKCMAGILCLSMMSTFNGVAHITAYAAEDTYVYGTMNIPYGEFFKAEGVDYEVDAVTSATTGKWKNENLVSGSYSEAVLDENGEIVGGKILGVTYYVAITENDLAELGENDYSFTQLSEVPQAYKTVTVENGEADFSKVKGATTAFTSGTEILTETRYGDYQVNISDLTNSAGVSDVGVIYGVIFHTEEGNSYAMRHLENIWKNQIAWSVGYVTSVHNCPLHYEEYRGMMGETINEIVIITETGYHTVETDTYIPVKFGGEVTVLDADRNAGTTEIAVTTPENVQFPSDFNAIYTVDGIADINVSNGTLLFPAGTANDTYTFTISDADEKYADITAEFTLTTTEVPVSFDAEAKALVAAENISEEEFTKYVSKISAVTVNGTKYSASGRGATKLFNEDGTLIADAEPIAAEGNYEISVTSTSYVNNVTFTYAVGGNSETEETTTIQTEETTEETTISVNNHTVTEDKGTGESTTVNTDKTANPVTGDNGFAQYIIAMLAAAGAVIYGRKKKCSL